MKKSIATNLLLFLALTACAGAVLAVSAACDIFQTARLNMPALTGASRAYIEWFNLLDTEMLSVCTGK